MAKLIKTIGEYEVEIRDPYWEEAGKDGQPGMALVLPGFCEIDGEEYTINGRLFFTPTLISSGANQGLPLYQLSAETCIKIGMSEPFSPEKREELDGKKAVFVVQEEEYKGKKNIRVAFVNPPGRGALPDKKAKDIWAIMLGDEASQDTPFDNEPDAKPDDDIPF